MAGKTWVLRQQKAPLSPARQLVGLRARAHRKKMLPFYVARNKRILFTSLAQMMDTWPRPSFHNAAGFFCSGHFSVIASTAC